MQAAINIVNTYANEHHYGINPSKSATLSYNTQLQPSFYMNDSAIPYPEEYTHLGVVRNQSNLLNVDERIQIARRTAYALMGAGLHGKDGLSPHISYHVWATYVIPRMLYGLEVATCRESDINKLEAFQRKTLRQLQFLPEKPTPSNVAVYGLLGAKSIRATVEQLMLTHFGNILRSEGSIEWDLANRQLAIKDDKSKSWFVGIKRLLVKYDLPSAYELFEDPPKKTEWKAMVTSAINSYNRAKFNQFDVDPTCTICNDGPEDRCHFILGCNRLENTRRYHIGRIFRLLQRVYSFKIAETLIRSKNSLLQIILDCTHDSLSNLEIQPPLSAICEDIEPMSRLMCFSLHMRRASMLNVFVG